MFRETGRYVSVNRSWPEVLPDLTPAEAVSAAKRLYRIGFQLFDVKRAFRGPAKVTSGNRYNWVRRGTLYVNPEKGWRHLVHDMSHYVHRRARPNDVGHSPNHAWLERELANHVIDQGWLDGALKCAPREPKPKADPKIARYQRVCDRLKRWESRLKRARTAIQKLTRAKTRYERTATNSGSLAGSHPT